MNQKSSFDLNHRLIACRTAERVYQMDWKEMAERTLPLMQEWRRQIHQYPEIGFQDHELPNILPGLCRVWV